MTDLHLADVALDSLRNHEHRGGRARSSDLSVDEAVLLDETGYETCGLVSGATVFHIGYSGLFLNAGNQEMTQISDAMQSARHLAMSRLTEEARRVGGHGLVGVHLQMRMIPGSALAEFFAMGTAVRPKHGANVPASEYFFTSDLSGQDFYLLRRAGYLPVGLVMGSCVYHVARRGIGQWISQRTQNVELENFTTAFYDARELAMTRLEHEARSLQADGVVGMHIHEQSHVWGAHVVEFLALGTAIRLVADEHQNHEVRAVVPLND